MRTTQPLSLADYSVDELITRLQAGSVVERAGAALQLGERLRRTFTPEIAMALRDAAQDEKNAKVRLRGITVGEMCIAGLIQSGNEEGMHEGQQLHERLDERGRDNISWMVRSNQEDGVTKQPQAA